MRVKALLLLALCAGTTAAAPARHLVVIAIDTLRADHLSCYGYERPTSPTLDALAARGVLFERAIATAPWTLPSFASMFTGRMPTRHGAGLSGERRSLGEDTPHPLSPTVPTLAEQLAGEGFRCAAFTSNPFLRLGLQRGFEEFFCQTIEAERVGALARAWIETRDDTARNFLFVHFNDPHEPTDPPEVFLRELGVSGTVQADPHRVALERWGDGESDLGHAASVEAVRGPLATKVALYDATILQVDRQIARLLASLASQGMLDNSLVVVLSDHGEEFLEHVAPERALDEDPRGLHGIGHGHTLYDELLHVPLLLMGPDLPSGQRIPQQISLLDLMPTLLSLLGIETPAGMDGADRSAWMADEARADLPVAAEGIAYGVDRLALWQDGSKVIADRFGRPLWQFDLRTDPRELLALPAIDPLLLQQLIAAADGWSAEAPPLLDPARMDPELLEGLRALGYVE